MSSSITDVAREANVAPSTVSLVINDKPNVSDYTRSQVKAVIKRLKYKPRQAKRISRVAVVYTQNMMVNGSLAEYCRRWIAGIREGIASSQSQVTIFAGSLTVEDDLLFTQMLDHRECDGVIIMGAYPKHGYLERVLASGVPMVAFARHPEHSEFSAVCVDHHALGSQVARHLHGTGHRRLGLLTGPNDVYPTRMLRKGFFSTLEIDVPAGSALNRQQGASAMTAMASDRASVLYDFQAPSGALDESFFDKVLDDLIAAKVTAIFTGDPAALRLATAMERRGMTPGKEISLMGIDDMGLITPGGKRLTSMGYDKLVMGQIAGQMMLQLIQMGDHISHQFTSVQPFLVKGHTLNAPMS